MRRIGDNSCQKGEKSFRWEAEASVELLLPPDPYGLWLLGNKKILLETVKGENQCPWGKEVHSS